MSAVRRRQRLPTGSSTLASSGPPSTDRRGGVVALVHQVYDSGRLSSLSLLRFHRLSSTVSVKCHVVLITFTATFGK